MNRSLSQNLYKIAQELMPGGVNSPVRAFRSVGLDPVFIREAHGSKIYDVDGNEYIDYVGSWGPMILGHSHPRVIKAVEEALHKGSSFGAPTELEIELARMIVEAIPSIEMLRMVNSGTEAVMAAIRLARGFTGRDRIIKFEGCYHGHFDGLLVQAGSGAMTLGIPGSKGVPSDYARHTCLLPFNDEEAVRRAVDEDPEGFACIIVEPIAGNMGVIPPRDGYLEFLRKLTQEHGILLVFDEVITGFRVAYGGAQALYGITPDLTCLGKIIGGGLPVGAYGGRRDIMESVAPLGGVYQAGTLSGNPLAMSAGLETLRILKETDPYQPLEQLGSYLAEESLKEAKKAGIPVRLNRVGSLSCLFFTDQEVVDYRSASACDTERFAAYFKGMLERGIYLAPSQFEASFLSTAHTQEDIETTLRAAREAFVTL